MRCRTNIYLGQQTIFITSNEGNLEELKEKWLSILSHICDIHEFPRNNFFKRCQHEKIDRKWLSPDSSAFSALKKVISEKRFIADLKYFSEFSHTGNLEVFHSVLLKYCPKRLHFSFPGMIAQDAVSGSAFQRSNKIRTCINE